MMGLDPNAPAELRNRDVDALFVMLKDLVEAAKRIATALERGAGPAASATPLEVDIDAGDGNPEVSFVPRAWKGESMKGKAFADCPADFLDVLAGALEGMAAAPKEGKEKYAHGNRVLAAKARAWAKRKRSNGEGAPSADGEGFVE